MPLSADTRPHFTTIGKFVASLNREILQLFLEALIVIFTGSEGCRVLLAVRKVYEVLRNGWGYLKLPR
jgi:hypothetical protein